MMGQMRRILIISSTASLSMAVREENQRVVPPCEFSSLTDSCELMRAMMMMMQTTASCVSVVLRSECAAADAALRERA